MPSGNRMTVSGRLRSDRSRWGATASKYPMRSPLVSPSLGQNTLFRFEGSTPPGTPRPYTGLPLGDAYNRAGGAWRSLAARVVWDHEVPGSNPGAPTSHQPDARLTQ